MDDESTDRTGIGQSAPGRHLGSPGWFRALDQLADSTPALAARLGSGLGEDTVGEIQLVFAVALLAFAALPFVPAAGALVLPPNVNVGGQCARACATEHGVLALGQPAEERRRPLPEAPGWTGTAAVG